MNVCMNEFINPGSEQPVNLLTNILLKYHPPHKITQFDESMFPLTEQ